MNLSQRSILARTFVLLLLTVISAAATAFPLQLTYVGRLVGSDGKPMTGPVNLSAAFYRAAEGGDSLTEQPYSFNAVTLKKGMFEINITLDATDMNTIFNGTDDVYIQITDTSHSVAYPRQKYNVVPYALKVPVDNTSIVYDDSGNLSVAQLSELKLKASETAVVHLKPSATAADGTTFTLPSSAQAGLFLTTDASGNLSWGSPGVTSSGIADNSITTAKLVDANVTDAKIDTVSASKLTGALPAISGANLTALPATLPAASGANLTNLNGSNISSGTVPSARLDTGATANKIVQLDGSGKLPAVDGSQLTGLSSIAVTGVTAGTGLTGGGTSGSVTLNVDVGTAAGKIIQSAAGNKLPVIDGSNLTNLTAANLSGALPAISGASLTSIPAGNLTGTLPNGVFPATLPAASAANLTSIPAANLTGTLPNGVFPATLPAASAANLTSVPAANLTGTLPDATFPATLPATSGANLTSLNGSNIASGTVPVARLDTGTTANKIVLLNGSAQIPAIDGSLLTSLSSTNLNFRNGFVLFDDFMTGALSATGLAGNGDLGWVYTFNGTNIWQPQIATTTYANHPGLYRCTAGAAGNYAALSLGKVANGSVFLNATQSGTITMEYSMAVPASGVNTGTLYFGLGDAVTTAPTIGAYFLVTVAATSNYKGCTGNNCATTTGATNLADAAFHTYTITITDNTSVDFKVDGASITGSPIVGLPGAAVFPVIRCAWSAGTGPNIDLDYFKYTQVFKVAR